MLRQNLTFRVFVSSTFSDFIPERNELQTRVFPSLFKFCEERGASFQAIDLRWGVSDEAAMDQQAMSICMEELRRCQDASPRPNFLVLMGHRYGWRPLPPEIPAADFEHLLALLPTGDEDKTLLHTDEVVPAWTRGCARTGWYRRDENAEPLVYVLQARRVALPDGANSGGSVWQQLHEEENADWSRIERRMKAAFARALEKSGWATASLLGENISFGDPRRWLHEFSATHHEITAGAVAMVEAEGGGNVFVFRRDIRGLPAASEAGNWIDSTEDGDDSDARLNVLARQLRASLPGGGFHEFSCDWQPGGGIGGGHLASFCSEVESCLKSVIEREIAAFRSGESALTQSREARCHAKFATELAGSHFRGRTRELEAIRAYIAGNDDRPLVVRGMSGCGKSSLMARAWIETPDSHCKRIARFCGTTPAASTLAGLLESIAAEIPLEAEIAGPAGRAHQFFHELAGAADSTPVVLFIDAVDQLERHGGAHELNWLPEKLPAGVRMVVSVLDADGAEGDAARAAARFGNQLRVDALETADCEALLDSWLKAAGRRVSTPAQRAELSRVAGSGATPLALRLMYEQAARWRSWGDARLPGADVESLLESHFNQMAAHRHHGELLLARAIACIASARRGLAESELLAILSADPDVRAELNAHSSAGRLVRETTGQRDSLPAAVWARLHADLKLYLANRLAPGGVEVLAFFHRAIRDFARRWSERRGIHAHDTLAAWFTAKADPHGDGTWRGPVLRPFDELPWQASRSSAHPCQRLLGSLLFCAAKSAHGAVFDLVADFDDLPGTTVPPAALRQLRHLLQMNAPQLARHPECALQQLLIGVTMFTRPAEDLLAQSAAIQREAARFGIVLQAVLPEYRARGMALSTAGGHGAPVACVFRDGILLREANGAWIEFTATMEPRASGTGSSASFSKFIGSGGCVVSIGGANVVVRSPWPSGEPLLHRAPGAIAAAAMSGDRLALAIADGTVIVLRVTADAMDACAEFQTGTKPVEIVGTDGDALRLMGEDGSAWLLKSDGTKESHRIEGGEAVKLAGMLSDGCVAFADEHGAIHCADSGGRIRWRVQPPSSPRSITAIRRAECKFAIGLQNGGVLLLNAEDGTQASSFVVSSAAILSLAWHSESDFLLCGDSTGRFFVVWLQNDPVLESHAFPKSMQPVCGWWNDSQSALEMVGEDGSRDVITRAGCEEKAGHIPGPLTAAEMLSDGRLLCIHRHEQISRLLECEPGPGGARSVKELWDGEKSDLMMIHTFAASPCGDHIFMSCLGAEAGIGLKSFTKRGWLGFRPSWSRIEADISEAVISVGGRVMVITQDRGRAQPRRPARVLFSGRHRHVLLESGWGGGVGGIDRGEAAYLMGSGVSHDGKIIAAVDDEKRLRIFTYDPDAPATPPQPSGMWPSAATCLLFPSGRGCVVLQPDNAVRILDLTAPAQPRVHATALPPGQISCWALDEPAGALLLVSHGFALMLKFEPLP